jgi:hypothetical protein
MSLAWECAIRFVRRSALCHTEFITMIGHYSILFRNYTEAHIDTATSGLPGVYLKNLWVARGVVFPVLGYTL